MASDERGSFAGGPREVLHGMFGWLPEQGGGRGPGAGGRTFSWDGISEGPGAAAFQGGGVFAAPGEVFAGGGGLLAGGLDPPWRWEPRPPVLAFPR